MVSGDGSAVPTDLGAREDAGLAKLMRRCKGRDSRGVLPLTLVGLETRPSTPKRPSNWSDVWLEALTRSDRVWLVRDAICTFCGSRLNGNVPFRLA